MNYPNDENTLDTPSHSAVVVLYEKATDALILTKRSSHLRAHPGDICFPGGRWQIGDTNFWETALRELHEELDIDPLRVHFLKKMEPEKTLGGVVIHPWLASINSLIPYSANVREVAAVLSIPMRDVNVLVHYKDIVVNKDGELISSAQFTASDYFIWGVTARIMRQLCSIDLISLTT